MHLKLKLGIRPVRMMWRHLLTVGFAWVITAGAQQPVVQAPPAEQVAVVPADLGILDVQADHLSYDASRRLVIARGGVRVARRMDSLSADYAEVDTESEQVFARGNVMIHYSGKVWQGEEATYNFRTGVGDFGHFEAYSDPFYLVGRDSRRVSPTRMEFDGVMLTTCDPDSPEYSIRAGSASLEHNKILRAKHIRFQFGPVPYFYVPYVRANLEELAKFEFTPGWSSAMGPFLLTTYNQPINDVWRSRTHVDVRQRRGIGLGQDFLWRDPDGWYDGMVRAYYTDDRNPWRNDKEKREREALIDNDRYWLQIKDRHNLTDRDYLITELNYVSDPWVLSDFFDDLYRQNVQPENRVTLSHRGNNYSAGVGLNARLNDFYDNVNRLPEVFLNFNRQQIFETPLFYEGANTLSYLDKVHADGSTTEDYDAFRFDTLNMIYLPTRSFGFLSIIPRAGYRGTFFSKTYEQYSITNAVLATNDLGEAYVTNAVETITQDGSAAWRNLPEIGVESSFKAFGDLYRGPTGIEEDMDLRHVAEPYINYTLRFEPNVLPEELWQFDSVDELDYRNDLLVGMRNYLQTKRKDSPHNLIYADVFSTLRMDPDEDEETLGDIGFRTEWRPLTWFSWDFDGAYDTQDDSIRDFNTQVKFDVKDTMLFGLDYRFRRDRSETVAGDFTLFPEQRWSARVYVRMDIEESHVEEHAYYLIHRTRCLGIGVGLRIRPAREDDDDDNYTGWLRIWPLALPGFASMLGV